MFSQWEEKPLSRKSTHLSRSLSNSQHRAKKAERQWEGVGKLVLPDLSKSAHWGRSSGLWCDLTVFSCQEVKLALCKIRAYMNGSLGRVAWVQKRVGRERSDCFWRTSCKRGAKHDHSHMGKRQRVILRYKCIKSLQNYAREHQHCSPKSGIPKQLSLIHFRT